MRPLLYILFTTGILELVHSHQVLVKEPRPYCATCGSTVCYVDDCTFSHGSKDPGQLSEELNNQYAKISEYMMANKLVINDDKTQLVVVASRHARDLGDQVQLQAGNHLIKPSSNATLLGGVISNDAKWRQHIMGHNHNQSLISQLTSRIN